MLNFVENTKCILFHFLLNVCIFFKFLKKWLGCGGFGNLKLSFILFWISSSKTLEQQQSQKLSISWRSSDPLVEWSQSSSSNTSRSGYVLYDFGSWSWTRGARSRTQYFRYPVFIKLAKILFLSWKLASKWDLFVVNIRPAEFHYWEQIT